MDQHSSCDFFFIQAYAKSQSIKSELRAINVWKQKNAQWDCLQFSSHANDISEYYKALTRAKAALFSHIISRGRNHPGTLFNIKGMFVDVETLVNHSALTLNVCNYLLNRIWSVAACLLCPQNHSFLSALLYKLHSDDLDILLIEKTSNQHCINKLEVLFTGSAYKTSRNNEVITGVWNFSINFKYNLILLCRIILIS